MRRLVLLFGLAALAAGIWIMVSAAGTTPVPSTIGAGNSNRETGSGPTLTGERVEPEEPVEFTETGFEREEVEATEAAAAPNAELVRVLVTKKETGEPVPGAEVLYYGGTSFSYAEMSPEDQEEYQRLARDQEKLARRFGTVEFADSEGVAFIPVDEFTFAIGRHGALYGQLNLDAETMGEVEVHELELERDVNLLIRVLDSRSAPAAGVPIALVPQWKEESSQNRYFPYEIARTEGPDGLATIPHMQVHAQLWSQQGRSPESFMVRPYIPGLTEGGMPIDMEASSTDPVVLRLPPTGRVVVETTDIRGNRITSSLAAVILSLPPDDPQQDLRMYNAPPDERWFAPGKDGETVFDWVVTGKTYMANSYVSMEALHKTFMGPVAQDQEIHVMLSLTNEAYRVVGRVVDENFEPLRNAGLQLSVETARMSSSGMPLQTDEDGRFAVSLGTAEREMTIDMLTIRNEPLGVRASGPFSMFTLQGPRQLVSGDNDLGDVILESAPLVAAGRILVDGEPTRRRRFDINIQRGEIVQSRTTTRERWRQEQGLQLTFLDEGRFEIRGVAQAPRYRVMMYDYERRYLPLDPVTFVPGVEDLEIQLDSGGSMEAVVLLDESIPFEDLLIKLIPTEGQDQREEPDPRDSMAGFLFRQQNRLRARNTKSERERHTFQWGALWPGSYRFQALPRGAKQPLAAVPDIQIVAGERSRDPRLQEIDLRGKVLKIVVNVVDVQGKAIDPMTGRPLVLINDPTAGDELHGFGGIGLSIGSRTQTATVTVITAEPYLDLLVVARGYRPKELFGVRSDVTVMLEPFPEVVVRVAGTEVPEDHILQVSLRKTQAQSERDTRQVSYGNGGSGRLSSWARPTSVLHEVGDGGEIALPVDEDGSYTIRVYVTNETIGRPARIQGVDPEEVQVRESMGRQVFEIRISEEGLKQALKLAGGR